MTNWPALYSSFFQLEQHLWLPDTSLRLITTCAVGLVIAVIAQIDGLHEADVIHVLIAAVVLDSLMVSSGAGVAFITVVNRLLCDSPHCVEDICWETRPFGGTLLL